MEKAGARPEDAGRELHSLTLQQSNMLLLLSDMGLNQINSVPIQSWFPYFLVPKTVQDELEVHVEWQHRLILKKPTLSLQLCSTLCCAAE